MLRIQITDTGATCASGTVSVPHSQNGIMRHVTFVAAIATALCALGNPAMAFNPSDTPAEYELVFNASNPTLSSEIIVRDWIIENICDHSPGTSIDVFRRWTGFPSAWAVGCITRPGIDVNGDGDSADAGETLSARRVLFRTEFRGGVTPVTHPMAVPLGTEATYDVDPVMPGGIATGFRIPVMVITAGPSDTFNCNTTLYPPAAQATHGGTGYSEYKCGAATEQKVPDAGFSDIEPTKYFFLNQPVGQPDYVASTGVTTAPWGALVHNIAVSLDLRNALQASQGLTAGSETESDMPSLSTAVIRSYFVGAIPNWDRLLVVDPGNPGGPNIPFASHPGVIALGTVPTDRKVHICQRLPSSRPHFTAIFLNWPCNLNVTLPSAEVGGSLNGPFVHNNSSADWVTTCIDDYNNGTNNSAKNLPQSRRWTIGNGSSENVDNTKAVRIIKINGYAPTIRNVHAGNYEYFAEQSFQYRTNAATLLNGGGNPLYLPDVRNIFAYMARGLSPGQAALANLSHVYTWGQGGWLATPRAGGGFVPGNPFLLSNPVNSSTRAPFGRSLNTCGFPITIMPGHGGDGKP